MKRAENLPGKIPSVEKTVRLGRLHLRHLQRQKKAALPLGRHWSTRIQITPQVRADLMWWSHSACLRMVVPYVPHPPTVSVQTDALTRSWSFTCQRLKTKQESSLHITILEMKVLNLTLLKIPLLLSNQVILFLVDNTTMVGYVLKHGGNPFSSSHARDENTDRARKSCSSTI